MGWFSKGWARGSREGEYSDPLAGVNAKMQQAHQNSQASQGSQGSQVYQGYQSYQSNGQAGNVGSSQFQNGTQQGYGNYYPTVMGDGQDEEENKPNASSQFKGPNMQQAYNPNAQTYAQVMGMKSPMQKSTQASMDGYKPPKWNKSGRRVARGPTGGMRFERKRR